jgi:hypothetical protein
MEQTNETNKDVENAGKQEKARRKKRTFSRYVLPSNRHTFQIHFDVLRRFVTLGRTGGVAASEVEGEGVPTQAASMNVRFMRSVGLLAVTERGKYIPTQDAIQFINAKSVSDDRAKPILAALISKSWFADIAQSLFRTQPIMSEDQFLGELALAAQTDKTKEQEALRTILEYLVYAGMVVRDERGLSLGSPTMVGASEQGLAGAAHPVAAAPSDVRQLERTMSEPTGWHVLQTEDFHVRVKSDLDVVDDLMAHLETLKRKITRLKGGNS